MAIVAYASGAQNLPNENPPASYTQAHDPVITLANQNLPLDVNLYGAAVDSEDANAVFTFQWVVLSQSQQDPPIALSNGGLVQNVTVQQINAWGNIRCFLIATNQTTGDRSETDPLRAPDSAFVTVRVRSPHAAIQKIAAGERNWNNDADEWAQAIEDIRAGANGLTPHTIPEHTDVNTTTGEDLDVLTGGGYADDPAVNGANPNGALHIHRGDQVDAATRGTRGTITIEDNAGPVRAINVERMVLTCNINTTKDDLGRAVSGILPHQAFDNGHPQSNNLCTWHVATSVKIIGFYISLKNGGAANPGTDYKFDLVLGSSANFVNNQMVRQNINLTGSPAQNFQPLFLGQKNLAIEVGEDDLIGLQCVAGPFKDAQELASGLTATVILSRSAS